MKYLRKSTAATVAVGPFVTSAGVPLTSLSISSTFNGRAISNGSGAAFSPSTFTHDGSGTYLVGLAGTDVPTAGRFRLAFSDPATYLPVWEDFSVLEAAVYDVIFGTTALSTYTGGSVTLAAAQAFNNTGQTQAVPATVSAVNGLAPPTNWGLQSIDGSGRMLLQPTQTGVTIPNVTNVGTLTTYTGNTPQTGDAYTRIGAAGAGLTSLGDMRLGNLDVAVSTRSTYTGGNVTVGGYATGQTPAKAGDAMSLTGGEHTALASIVAASAVASVTAPVAVASVSDKTGYILAATGLDSITATLPAGPAATFPQMLVQIWNRFLGKGLKSPTQLVTYRADGVTPATTQTLTDNGTGTQTQSASV